MPATHQTHRPATIHWASLPSRARAPDQAALRTGDVFVAVESPREQEGAPGAWKGKEYKSRCDKVNSFDEPDFRISVRPSASKSPGPARHSIAASSPAMSPEQRPGEGRPGGHRMPPAPPRVESIASLAVPRLTSIEAVPAPGRRAASGRSAAPSWSWSSCVALKTAPRSGMSPSNGILRDRRVLRSSIRPPMTIVWPSLIPTRLSADRLAMIGAVHVLRDRHGRAGQLADLRRHVQDDQPVRVDVRRDVQNDADVLVLDRVDRLAGVGDARVGDERHLLADGDDGKLVVAGQDVGARQHVELAGGGQGVQRGVDVPFEQADGQPAAWRRWRRRCPGCCTQTGRCRWRGC